MKAARAERKSSHTRSRRLAKQPSGMVKIMGRLQYQVLRWLRRQGGQGSTTQLIRGHPGMHLGSLGKIEDWGWIALTTCGQCHGPAAEVSMTLRGQEALEQMDRVLQGRMPPQRIPRPGSRNGFGILQFLVLDILEQQVMPRTLTEVTTILSRRLGDSRDAGTVSNVIRPVAAEGYILTTRNRLGHPEYQITAKGRQAMQEE